MCLVLRKGINKKCYITLQENDRAIIKDTAQHKGLAGKMVRRRGAVGDLIVVRPFVNTVGGHGALISMDEIERIILMS